MAEVTATAGATRLAGLSRLVSDRAQVVFTAALTGTTLLAGAAVATNFFGHAPTQLPAAHTAVSAPPPRTLTGPPYRFERAANPARTLVKDAGGSLAGTLTDGARTAVLTGARRTLAEPSTTEAVVHTQDWVRLLPKPWKAGTEKAGWFQPWLTKNLASTAPDVLHVATQYTKGAPTVRAGATRTAGDASFGPVTSADAAHDTVSDARREGSDFYNYLGSGWSFPNGVAARPTREMYGAVDCSGYVRLVYGYRMKYPLDHTTERRGGLPRRAVHIAAYGPGTMVLRDRGARTRWSEYSRLLPGDLVFFDGDPGDGPAIDHVGIHLGVDSKGHPRFISSRKIADGPTMGDLGGASRLDGNGHYALTFRAARRL